MAHGTQDWADVAPKSTVYGGIDLAEHAVRLGSIVTFDRRGDVLWFDDFESGIDKWLPDLQGNNAAVAWSADKARNGGFSCKLTMGTTGLRRTAILSMLPFPVAGKMGFEISFALDSDLDYAQALLEFFSPTGG